MSTEKKKINAGDTLTVGDLTDDHLGAVIEVGAVRGITYRLQLDRVVHDGSEHAALLAAGMDVRYAHRCYDVTVITPPPVVQPDEPKIIGQCIRIEGLPEWLALVTDPDRPYSMQYRTLEGSWFCCTWAHVLEDAGERQIIVSDPPRWPDETPVVPERIEVGEWPDDDTHLRAWKWIDNDICTWRWDNERKRWVWGRQGHIRPIDGPWTRGERVE